MNSHFAMDKKVMQQLKIIGSLQRRSKQTVFSLYAQAILEYSLYDFKKKKLQEKIDSALENQNKQLFNQYSIEYKQLIDSHRKGKMIKENGFELFLPFHETNT